MLLIFHTVGTGNLTISSLLVGGNSQTNANVGFIKSGSGTLTLSTPSSVLFDNVSAMLLVKRMFRVIWPPNVAVLLIAVRSTASPPMGRGAGKPL